MKSTRTPGYHAGRITPGGGNEAAGASGTASAAPDAARADIRRRAGGFLVVLAGDWLLEQPAPRSGALLEALPADADGAGRGVSLGFEVSGLGAWDSSLIVYLDQLHAQCEARGIAFDDAALPESVSRLLTLSRAVPEHRTAAVLPKVSRVQRVGVRAVAAWGATLEAVTFTGQVTDGVIRLLLGRLRLRWRDFWVVVQSNGSGALPIVTLIAFLVGVIIAFLGVVVLKRFGAGFYVSYLVGYGMLREMGALMTGIIMAGRTGAGFAAELGSMKITEEIDAFTTLGVSPVDHLVLPRVLGLFVMMPLLVVYADVVGIAGGMLVAVLMLDLSPTQFVGGMLSAVSLSDGLLGVFKGGVFGLIIGMAGCMKGLQTGSDASAVGRSATSAVVLGITLIIVANAVIDWLAALLQV